MKFEKLMEAILIDNNRIAKEIIEEFNRQLDLRSISREGYGLSRKIDQKLAILLEHDNLPLRQQEHTPDAMNNDIIDGDIPVDIEEEEIVILFDKPQPPDVIKRAIHKETKRQLKKRKHSWIPPWHA